MQNVITGIYSNVWGKQVHSGVDGGRSHGGEGTDNTRGPTDGD